MAYKGKSFVASSVADLMKQIKDFLILCGWELEGPSTDMGAQKDINGHMLGWWLKSNGEDTLSDVHCHIGVSQSSSSATTSYLWAVAEYITSAIDNAVTTIPVTDGTKFNPGDKVQIDDEVIIVGSVSSNDLVGCSRAWGPSSADSHVDGSVVINLTTGDPKTEVEVFPVVDFSALHTSTGTPSLTREDATNILNFDYAGLGLTRLQNDTGIANDTSSLFARNTCLIKVNDSGGAEDGVMRWIIDYNDTGNPVLGGDFDFQPFETVPGSVDSVEVICGGFLPAWSKRRTYATSDDLYRMNGQIYTDGVEDDPGGIPGYIYGSKDAFVVLVRNPDFYDVFLGGNVRSLANPNWTQSSIALSSGDTVVSVGNTSLFYPNQKVRVISKNPAIDWNANKDRSTDTYGGATAGDWDDLDPEEAPTELNRIASVDHGGGTITLASALIYSYAAPGGDGAIIGEDPRPLIRCANPAYSHFPNKTFVAPFNPVPGDKIGQHACHRQRCRTPHAVDEPWNATQASANTWYRHWELGILLATRVQADTDSKATDNKNYETDQLMTGHLLIETDHDIYHIEDIHNPMGDYDKAKGYVPFMYTILNTLSGVDEDTVKSQWGGQFETFRIFNAGGRGVGGEVWVICGPEIA